MNQHQDTVWIIEEETTGKYYEENANGDGTLGCEDVMSCRYFPSKERAEFVIKELTERGWGDKLRSLQMKYIFQWDFLSL